ncbi:MAG: hypothetical protein WB764_28805, partial [Xanthobacteraceae bacterium]
MTAGAVLGTFGQAVPVTPVTWAPDEGFAQTRSAALIKTPMLEICPIGICDSKPENVIGAYSL